MSPIMPCLWLDANAEEAARFYTTLFADGAITAISYWHEGMPGQARTVLGVDFTLGGRPFQAINGGPMFKPGITISFFVQAPDATEAGRLNDALIDGGMAMMPLGSYPWSPCYAWVQDRFGVSWQIIVGDGAIADTAIVPCLMFSDGQQGRAEEAMALYTRIFGGAIGAVERYAEGEGPVNFVKHGRFTVAGHGMVAMDSHVAHGAHFTEGLSFSVRCADQAEVDHLWDALCNDGGTPSRCGWLKDRFGVSWQVVPERFVELHLHGDAAGTARMFAAMMSMSRLDMAALEQAYHG